MTMAESEHPYATTARDLTGTPFASIRYLNETGSTNDDAAALLGDESAYGLTIVAEHQTHGAGRKGRSWLAQPGTSLLFTTILPRAMPAANLWIVPYGVAVAIRRALATNGVQTTLHWPNDLLLNDRKVAGILCATRIVADRAWVAAGVGINVRHTPGAEIGIDPPPAFLDEVADVDRASLLRDVLLNYEVWLDAMDMPQRVARVWEQEAEIPGRRYRILKDGETEPFEATAISLATGGGLVVEHDDGRRETIALADARALR
jgi:BirA family transcriptional regulator, biotin operon repressor / biotin---[acetyl-CoA-carboxylase] ligase